MERGERNRLIGGCIGFILCVCLLIYVSKLSKRQHAANVVSIQFAFKSIIEAGYVQGQADALKGRIRIRPVNDSTYVWTSSPWGNIKPCNDSVGVNIKYK